MMYLVNGDVLTRQDLIARVLECVLDLGEEKAPFMAYRPSYTVEYNVERHACKIARALMWDIEVIR